jgi:hypothetical protein
MGVNGSPLIAAPSPPGPGRWQFWADAIVGGAPLGPVAVSAFTATSKLSDWGTGSVTITHPSGLDPARITRLWSWRLWALYEGEPVWCGVPSGVTDDGSAATVLTLTELPGYLAFRQFDVFPNKTYTNTEQCAIAADLAAPVGDVGVAVATSVGSGSTLRTVVYQYLEAGARAQLLTQLAQMVAPFEFRAEYALSAGRPACTLRFAYPRVGQDNGLGITVPGDAVAYKTQWDSDHLRTRTFAVGDVDPTAAPGAARPVHVIDAPQPDLPRLDAADDWPGVSNVGMLTQYAQSASMVNAAPAAVITAKPMDSAPSVLGYAVGDDVQVNVTDPLLPSGYTALGRLHQIDIDAAAATAQWTVYVETPLPYHRETLAVRLRVLTLRVSSGFRNGAKTQV